MLKDSLKPTPQEKYVVNIHLSVLITCLLHIVSMHFFSVSGCEFNEVVPASCHTVPHTTQDYENRPFSKCLEDIFLMFNMLQCIHILTGQKRLSSGVRSNTATSSPAENLGPSAQATLL